MRGFLILAMLAALPSAAFPAAARRVWCVGDSITLRYARRLAARRPQWTVEDLGVGGERSGDGLVRLDRLLHDRGAPDVAIVIYGANDIVAGRLNREPGYGPLEAAGNLRRMAARLRAAGALPILALPVGAPPPAPGDAPDARAKLVALRRGFAELRRALWQERPHVDFRLVRHALFADALHPTPEGAEIIAARAMAAVARAMRAQRTSGTPGSTPRAPPATVPAR